VLLCLGSGDPPQLSFPHGAAVKAESMCMPGAVGLSPPVGGTAAAAAGGCCPRVKDVESNCSSGGVDATKDMAVDKYNTTKVGARSQ